MNCMSATPIGDFWNYSFILLKRNSISPRFIRTNCKFLSPFPPLFNAFLKFWLTFDAACTNLSFIIRILESVSVHQDLFYLWSIFKALFFLEYFLSRSEKHTIFLFCLHFLYIRCKQQFSRDSVSKIPYKKEEILCSVIWDGAVLIHLETVSPSDFLRLQMNLYSFFFSKKT